MKNPTLKTPKPGKSIKRSFTWGITSTEISFMRMTQAEGAMDGCSGSDCSKIAKFDKPRQKRPEKTGEQ
jgi:hypothetical protein